ncbi:MAG: hypothetical protein HQL50_04580 [Magnetococcales bacterium]|nr:hypothetical protein [Magnetococcales bacterium]
MRRFFNIACTRSDEWITRSRVTILAMMVGALLPVSELHAESPPVDSGPKTAQEQQSNNQDTPPETESQNRGDSAHSDGLDPAISSSLEEAKRHMLEALKALGNAGSEAVRQNKGEWLDKTREALEETGRVFREMEETLQKLPLPQLPDDSPPDAPPLSEEPDQPQSI